MKYTRGLETGLLDTDCLFNPSVEYTIHTEYLYLICTCMHRMAHMRRLYNVLGAVKIINSNMW